jgi:acetylglutamate kinase
MTPSVNIIKIGGNVIDDEVALASFIQRYAAIPGYKILVHGGGKLATRLAETLNIPTQIINGRRITDAASLQVVTMVYAGEINKRIVAALQSYHCNALGLCGADGNLIMAEKRVVEKTDYGFVGDVTDNSVNGVLLMQLLSAGLLPVVAPITHNGAGQLLNTNADTIASALAVAMSRHIHTNLIFCFEKNGVLRDVSNEDSVIPHINQENYQSLKEQNIISAGMIPKLDNAFAALQNGVSTVVIGSAANLEQLIQMQSGTIISNG